jgi:hypothetical protein
MSLLDHGQISLGHAEFVGYLFLCPAPLQACVFQIESCHGAIYS